MSTFTLRHAYADSVGERALHEAQLRMYEMDFGESHPDTLLAKNTLGITLLSLGQVAKARELLESVLSENRRVLGKRHPHTVTAMHNLALALSDLGEFERAIYLQKKVFKHQRRRFGEDHLETLSAMSCLAVIRFNHGDEHGASLLEEFVLETLKRTLGEDHLLTQEAVGILAGTINTMAVNLRNAGNLDEAEPLQLRALEMMIKAFGIHGLITAHAFSAAGALMKLKGNTLKAVEYFQKAIEIRERELGGDAELTQLVRGRLRDVLH